MRTLTISVLLLAFASLAASDWLTTRWFYTAGFEHAERDDAISRLRHTRDLIQQRVQAIRNYTSDSATWDDVYAYMHGADPDLPDRVFGDSSHEHMQLIAYAFLTTDGRLMRQGEYDPRQRRFVTTNLPLLTALGPAELAGPSASEDARYGYVRIGSGLYVWGSSPILRSNGGGPVAGTMVLLAALDQPFLDEVSRAVDAHVTLLIGSNEPRPEAADASAHDLPDEQYQRPNDTTIWAQTSLGKLRGSELLQVRVTRERPLHALALRQSRYVLISTLAFGILTAIFVLRFIEIYLLRPVTHASAQLRSIGESGDLAARVDVPRYARELQSIITAINQMLEQLEGKRDAEAARDAAIQASRLKSEFLATMSHEIRTPLNGMLGMNELLLTNELPDKQRELAQAVRTSGRHLLSVINDILDFSKIESGYLSLECVDFSLSELIDGTVAMFSNAAKQKGLILAADFKPAPPTQDALRGDPFRLKQVLTNLVGNAIKFTETGGVTVHVMSSVDPDGACRLGIHVADTGVGISSQAQKNIFDPFLQADNSTTRRYGGTGLGLAICWRLLKLMGGTIRVESRPGAGSRFVVELSLPKAHRPLPKPCESDVEDIGHAAGTRLHPTRFVGRVLLVEDNAVNQEVAIAMLDQLGLNAAVAANGREAVEAVRQQAFDLLLMDCHMPVMDGFAATAAIRALPGCAELPIVALTASAMSGDELACRQAGMNDFLAKPFMLAQLQETLSRWLLAVDDSPAAAGSALHAAAAAARR